MKNNIANTQDKNFLDGMLIGFLMVTLIVGLSFHIIWIYEGYQKLQSPFVPQDMVWEVLKPNFFHCVYFLIAIIISIFVIIKYYNRNIILLLLIAALVMDYILVSTMGEIVFSYELK